MLLDLPTKDGGLLALKKEYTAFRDKVMLRRMRIKLTMFDISLGYEANNEFLQDENFLKNTLIGFAEKISQMTEQEFTQWFKKTLMTQCPLLYYDVSRKQKESLEQVDALEKPDKMYDLFIDFMTDLDIIK